MSWDWHYVLEILPELLQATIVTVRLALLGFVVAIVVGLLVAIARLSNDRIISTLAWGFTEFVRLTPLLVQLFFAFYVLPEIGIKLPAEPTGVLVIGLHYAAYTSEVYRSGIRAVATEQWEASIALNLSTFAIWRRIILPQAVPPMIPALGNYLIQLFKEIPLLSTITVYELLNTGNLLASSSFRYLETLTLVGVIFLLLSYPSSLLIRRLESNLVKT
ncbi:MAG: ectoine/hydroxyectoine ABC transporter permease subunit EhuD [Gammaproteobacteria bacterium]|nr:ectoine/hydroxyectoine ABC transporter permease subunit EhuD [Gammaproteobacteria bacterium]